MSDKPEPWHRPAVDISPVSRHWKDVRVEELATGDVVVDIGLLTAIDFGGSIVKVTNATGVRYLRNSDEVVMAFVRR